MARIFPLIVKWLGPIAVGAGISEGIPFLGERIGNWARGYDLAFSKLMNNLAQDVDVANGVYGMINQVKSVLGLNDEQLAAVVGLIRIVSTINPQAMNIMIRGTSGAISNSLLDDVLKYADSIAVKSWQGTGYNHDTYTKVLDEVIAKADGVKVSNVPQTGGSTPVSTENKKVVNTPQGKIIINTDDYPDIAKGEDEDEEIPISSFANPKPGANLTSGSTNHGTSNKVLYYRIQQALILAGYGVDSPTILLVDGDGSGLSGNSQLFDRLIQEFYVNRDLPGHYGITAWMLFELIETVDTSVALGVEVKTYLTNSLNSIIPGAVTSEFSEVLWPRERNVSGAGNQVTSDTIPWHKRASGYSSPAHLPTVLAVQQALLQMGYNYGYNSKRAFSSDMESVIGTSSSLRKDYSLRLTGSANGTAAWVMCHCVAQVLSEFSTMTATQINSWLTKDTQPWNATVGKALRDALLQYAPNSPLLVSDFTAGNYP